MTENQDLNITGAGSYPGGLFNKVMIAGAGEVDGDIECTKFSASGACEVKGSIICEHLSIAGAGEIRGNVTGGVLKIKGACTIRGDVKGTFLEVAGATDIQGNVRVEKINLYGGAEIAGDIDAEELHIVGGIDHKQLINAERVVMEVGNKTDGITFNEIGATSVLMNKKEGYKGWLKFFNFFRRTGRISGHVIEADTIKLEYAKIDVLRGRDIEIGKGCRIENVEYTGSLIVHESAYVKESELIAQ